MQTDAELVAMLMTVALAHDLDKRNRLDTCPVLWTFIGAQPGSPVSGPYLRRSRWQLNLRGKPRVIDQVWGITRDHRHKGAVARVTRGIVSSDECFMHDDVALGDGGINEDQVAHGVG